MGKKVIISSSVAALSLGLALGLFSASASATDEAREIQPRTVEIQPRTIDEEIECDEANNDCADLIDLQETNDTEIILAEDEDGVTEVEDIEVESEPEMWPVYVSLGAIGVMILMIIVLNLTGKKKK